MSLHGNPLGGTILGIAGVVISLMAFAAGHEGHGGILFLLSAWAVTIAGISLVVTFGWPQ